MKRLQAIHRRQAVTVFFLIVLALSFWSQSRYPALNEKLQKGDRVRFSGIAFSPWIPVSPSDGPGMRTAKQTLNWYETNWRGMAFGLAFAAGTMALLGAPSRRRKRTRQQLGRWGSAGFGTIVGAPLGLCTNCSAPLGRSLSELDFPPAAAFAMVVASPTLNFVALDILWRQFGATEALLRIAATLILLFLVIPLIAQNAHRHSPQGVPSGTKNPVGLQNSIERESWLEAFRGALGDWLMRLLQVLRFSIPAMLTAGVLGALLIEFLPFDQWISEPLSIGKLFAFSTATALLPAPMTFDLAFASALKNNGAAIPIYMTALFNLGSYSLFSLWLLGRSTSWKSAFALLAAVILIGPALGYSRDFFESRAHSHAVAEANGLKEQRQQQIATHLDTWLTKHSDKARESRLWRMALVSQVARRTRTPAICDKLETSDKNRCLEDVSSRYSRAIGTGLDPYTEQMRCQFLSSVGRTVADISRCQDSVLAATAAGAQKVELCGKAIRQECIDRIAWNHGSTFNCDLLPAPARGPCQMSSQVFARSGDKSPGRFEICSEAKGWLQDICIETVAFRLINSWLNQSNETGQIAEQAQLLHESRNVDPVTAEEPISEPRPEFTWEKVESGNGWRLMRSPLQSRSDSNGTFEVIAGSQVGLKSLPDPHVSGVAPGLSAFNYATPIAALDVNNDEWPDVVSLDRIGLIAYINTKSGFAPERWPAGEAGDGAFLTFVPFDRNGDGILDILAVTKDGHFYSYILGGRAEQMKFIEPQFEEDLTRLTRRRAPRTLASGELNGDGQLELLVANPTVVGQGEPMPLAIALDERGRFVKFNTAVNSPSGAALSILVDDFDGDQKPDVIVGVDLAQPDAFFMSKGKTSDFTKMEKVSAFPHTPFYTMSYDAADINGDGRLDLFGTDMTLHPQPKESYCSLATTSQSAKQDCESLAATAKSIRDQSVSGCIESSFRSTCLGLLSTTIAMQMHDANLCPKESALSDWPARYCQYAMSSSLGNRSGYQVEAGLPQVTRNVLLMGSEKTGQLIYQDETQSRGVVDTGWAWNSKFADFDGDGRPDILVGNGRFARDQYSLNALLMNTPSGHFERAERKVGLIDWADTPSFAIADFDRDGDLDVVATGINTGLKYYRNRIASRAEANSLLLILNEERPNQPRQEKIGHTTQIGAHAFGKAGDLKLLRSLRLSGGFHSYDEPVFHFGLGQKVRLDDVRVQWPDGLMVKIQKPLEANSVYKLIREN